MALVDVVEVLSRRHCLVQTGEMAMLFFRGVFISTTPNIE